MGLEDRMISKDFHRDEKIGMLPPEGRLLYVGLIQAAEPATGVGRANIRLLRADVFPYDDYTVSQVEEWFEQIVKSGMIRVYEVDGQKYYWVKKFKKHQYLPRARKATLPLPPEFEEEVVEEVEEPVFESPIQEIKRLVENTPKNNDFMQENADNLSTTCKLHVNDIQDTCEIHENDMPNRNRNRNIEKEIEKEKELEKEVLSGAINTAPNKIIVSVILKNGEEYPIYENQEKEWGELYPDIDVIQELRNYKGWCLRNPTKRKTKTGILRSIDSWLRKAQTEQSYKQPKKPIQTTKSVYKPDIQSQKNDDYFNSLENTFEMQWVGG